MIKLSIRGRMLLLVFASLLRRGGALSCGDSYRCRRKKHPVRSGTEGTCDFIFRAEGTSGGCRRRRGSAEFGEPQHCGTGPPHDGRGKWRDIHRAGRRGLYASMDPAKDVGGDFYDFYLLDEGRLVITIADVSGKGVPAALFMAKSQSVLKNCVMKAKGSELALAMGEANRQLCRNNEAAMFVTVFLGMLDLSTGRLDYVNGGHCPPILGKAGGYDFLPMKSNMVLGLMDFSYEQQHVTLARGGHPPPLHGRGFGSHGREGTAFHGIPHQGGNEHHAVESEGGGYFVEAAGKAPSARRRRRAVRRYHHAGIVV